MRVLELFAGAGGMALGFRRAGWETAGLCEIDPHATRVLAARFPGVPLYGDVTTFDGTQFVADHGAVSLVTGGAPCQDLSVAGKRAGLQGDRSILFYELIRIWEETGADYCLYENVLGALSSAQGADFAAVLSAFVGADVAVPRKGWKGGGGVVAGPAGVAAWRVLDAQHFGVPQRRRRVFVLGARPGALDPAELLLEWEGGGWHPQTGSEAGEDVTPSPGSGTSGGDWQWWDGRQVAPTLDCAQLVKGQMMPDKDRFPVVVPAHTHSIDRHSGGVTTDITATPKTDLAHQMGPVVVVQEAVSFYENQRGELRLGAVTQALAGAGGKPGQGYAAVLQPEAIGWDEEINAKPELMGTLKARKLGGGHEMGVLPTPIGRPRRLMPIETERLMGWEDGFTDVPDAKGKPMADSHRYKMCGNGVVSHVAEWIGRAILEAEHLTSGGST